MMYRVFGVGPGFPAGKEQICETVSEAENHVNAMMGLQLTVRVFSEFGEELSNEQLASLKAQEVAAQRAQLLGR
jgi:hypothetical protein